jgi:hypothetical protein
MKRPVRNIPVEQIERAARLYRSVKEAGEALGISGHSFSRMCKRHDIVTPSERIRRQRKATKAA